MGFRAPVRIPSPDTAEGSSIAIEDNFQLRVLGEEEFTVACRLQNLSGRRMIVRLEAPVSVNACVRIDCEDALLLGEVLGTWRENSVIFGAIELQHGLSGLAKLRSKRDAFVSEAGDSVHRMSA